MNVRRRTIPFAAAVAVGAMALAGPAAAQTESIKDAEVQKKALAGTSTTVPDGWKLKAKVGLTGNLTSTNGNAAAAGAGQEGISFQFGLVLGAEANFKHGQHGWDTKLGYQIGQAKTPSIDQFIKNVDNLELVSTYFYRLNKPKWLGPFARFRFVTQTFKGNAVRADPFYLTLNNRDGTVINPTPDTTIPATTTSVPLTGAFEPVILRESLGAFAKPFQGDEFKLDAKLGAGAQQIVVRNGYTIQSEANNVITLRQLSDTSELGAELDVQMEGIVIKDLLSWRLGANFFLPLATNATLIDGTKASGFKGMNTDIQAAVSVKLAKWASLDYTLMVRQVPVVVEGFQVQHGLVLSAAFDIL